MRFPTRFALWTAGGLALSGLVLGLRRAAGDHAFDRIEHRLAAEASASPAVFSAAAVADLPEPARRYLLHALAPGTPLARSVRIEMEGTMTPAPGQPPVALRAVERLAPHRGFVWTAHARMGGLPVRVRDHYFAGVGGVRVELLGLVPLPSGGEADDLARASRGRLVGEAVWCPTALVGPGVTWARVDADRARFTLAVEGEAVAVTLHVGRDGALREVLLDRWGDAGVACCQPIPYGFAVEAEATFEGVTIPTRIRGGWWYGTARFDEAAAATFTVTDARFRTR